MGEGVETGGDSSEIGLVMKKKGTKFDNRYQC